MPSRNCLTRAVSWKVAYNQNLASVVKEVGWIGWVVFINIITSCDNLGRLEGEPATLRSMFFPLQPEVLETNVRLALNALHKSGLIVGYKVDGRLYVVLPKFGRYAPLVKRTMSPKSDYPEPPEEVIKTWEQKFKDNISKPELSIKVVQPLIDLDVATGEAVPENGSYHQVVNKWNTSGLPSVKAITPERQIKLRERWKSEHFRKNYGQAIEKVRDSGFCKGTIKGQSWKATIDWFICNDNNYVKALEGKYDDKESTFAKY